MNKGVPAPKRNKLIARAFFKDEKQKRQEMKVKLTKVLE